MDILAILQRLISWDQTPISLSKAPTPEKDMEDGAMVNGAENGVSEGEVWYIIIPMHHTIGLNDSAGTA
jgi:hypothetical protein